MTATVDTEFHAPAPHDEWRRSDAPRRHPGGPRRRPTPPEDRRRTVLALALVGVLGTALIGALLTAPDGGGSSDTLVAAEVDETSTVIDGDEAVAEVVEDADAAGGAVVQGAALPDLEGNLGQNEVDPVEPAPEVESERADGGCTIGALSLRVGESGAGVTCLQEALAEAGYYTGAPTGTFDDATLRAAMQYQEDEGLFVDGVVGRESAIELGIWPDEESLVVRTPPPAPGSMDSMGYTLSPVSSTGSDAPPLPENSGSGRRVVYDRAGQRVWAVSGDGEIIRSWLVSGSKYMNEMPGTHTVYSRSDVSTAWNGQAWLPLMIRYQQTDIGHIGFHAIPLHVSDNSPYQTTDELGTRLSGGCQRQANEDAAFLWAFAEVGTTVVVT